MAYQCYAFLNRFSHALLAWAGIPCNQITRYREEAGSPVHHAGPCARDAMPLAHARSKLRQSHEAKPGSVGRWGIPVTLCPQYCGWPDCIPHSHITSRAFHGFTAQQPYRRHWPIVTAAVTRRQLSCTWAIGAFRTRCRYTKIVWMACLHPKPPPGPSTGSLLSSHTAITGPSIISVVT